MFQNACVRSSRSAAFDRDAGRRSAPAQKSQEQANTDSTTEGKRDIRGFKLGMTNWR